MIAGKESNKCSQFHYFMVTPYRVSFGASTMFMGFTEVGEVESGVKFQHCNCSQPCRSLDAAIVKEA